MELMEHRGAAFEEALVGAAVSVEIQIGNKLEDVERLIVLMTLKQQGYNRTKTAKVLGIGLRTLQRKIKGYGLAGIGLSNKTSNVMQ